MKRFIQCTPRFDKCLKDLDKAGGKAALAAERARGIFARLVEEGDQTPFDTGRLTGHGESRLHNSIKYDLGNGYRLVCFLKGSICTLVFAGSHDDCNRWIRGQHSMAAHRRPSRTTTVAERRVARKRSGKRRIEAEQDDYEALLEEKIEETKIIEIFSGLCKRG